MVRRHKIRYIWIPIWRRWDWLRGQSWYYLLASRSLPSFTEIWPSVVYLEYYRFLFKKVEVVDCDFIAVPLIWAVTASRIFYTVTEHFKLTLKTMIFENQIPHLKLMSTFITWEPVRWLFAIIHSGVDPG